MRALLVLLLAAGLVSIPQPTAADRAPREDLRRALEVLRGWDDRRADAWAERDEARLRALYVEGSTAAAADVALLRRYTARGRAVRRLRTQIFAARVVARHPARIRVDLLDRVAGGIVDHGTGSARLRASPPARHVVDLRRVEGSWVVASVSDPGWGPGPRAAPPRRPGR